MLAAPLAGARSSPLPEAGAPAGPPGFPGPGPLPRGETAATPAGANLDVVRDRHGFGWAWSRGITGAGVNVAVIDDGVDLGHPDLQRTHAVVTDPSSPYLGWPIAYDPASLGAYLRTNSTAGTWFADTSLNGTGPFEETHTILVDGVNDFGEAEKVASDTRDDSAGAGGGDKEDYDLTDLYATRDASDWFFGFTAHLEGTNVSYSLLIDVDNETTGSAQAPGSKMVDTNTSHSNSVYDVAFSPDGTRVATAGADRTVRVWRVSDGNLLLDLYGHTDVPTSVAWSPDGTKLASADSDTLLLWDSSSGALLRNVRYVPTGNTTLADEPHVLDFNPAGTVIAAASNKYVHFIDASTGARTGTLWAFNGDINGVRYSPGGSSLAVALGNNNVVVYTVNATNVVSPPAVPATPAIAEYTLGAAQGGHTQPVLDVAWSPDGTKLASAGWDGMAAWDAVGRTAIAKRTDHGSRVAAVAFSPDSQRIASVSLGLGAIPASVLVWNAADGSRLLQLNQTKELKGVSWSSQNQIATASFDLAAKVWTNALALNRILIAHRPDVVIEVVGTSLPDGLGGYTHGLRAATLYTWDGAQWVSNPLADAGGAQASATATDGQFSEFSLPRSVLGDPPALSLTLFTTADNASRAQDTVPADPNVAFKNLDFAGGFNSLGAWAYRAPPAYRIQGITSASNTFHFGYHPSPILQRRFGALGILVVDPATAGRYDTVYVDLNGDKVFDSADVALSKANPVGALDNFDPRIPGAGQDGFEDLSAGMIYFIGDDANPLPYSDVAVARHAADGWVQRVPGNGDLVAFLGEFKLDVQKDEKAEHGTRMASALVGQGRLPSAVNGTAPDAKLIAIGNGQADPEEAWSFAVEGYDGLPGTGDEAQVALVPFNLPTTRHDGYDASSRALDWIAAEVGGGSTLFVASAGDYGFGYGTVASPAAAAAALAVGSAADYTDRSTAYGGAEGLNPQFGDVQATSARGPVPLGVQKPELVAIGRGNLDIPLASAADGGNATSSVPHAGTDLAAAVAAGAAALVYQAWKQDPGHGNAFPDMETARRVLMAAADDLRQDPLVQGAGFLNVTRAVQLALGDSAAWILPDTGSWVPGGFRGTTHEAFTNVLLPGDSETRTFTLENLGSSASTVAVTDGVFQKTGEYRLANTTTRDAFYAARGDIIFWLNDTGVWKVDPATFSAVKQLDPVAGLWTQADLLKVTAYSPYAEFAMKSGTSYSTNYTYNLKAWDWEASILPFPAPAVFTSDLNLLAETSHEANVLEVRVHRPAARLHDGIVVHLEIPDANRALEDQPWDFAVEFYRRVDWSWLTFNTGSVSVPASGTATFDATISVPTTAQIGTYEAVILLADASRGLTTTVPVLLNVAGNSPKIDLGGNTLTSDLYDNNRIFGGYDHKLQNDRISRTYLGDWRYYYFDLPDQGTLGTGAGYLMMADLAWDGARGDIDIQVYSPGDVDVNADQRSGRYGPYTLEVGALTEAYDRPEQKTASGGNEEVLTWDLTAGLNVVALHGNIVNGSADHEAFGGPVGWLRLDKSLTVRTNELVGEAPLFFMSSMNLAGLRASAVGPATTREFDDVPVYQEWANWDYPNFAEHLARAWFTYIVKVEKALILEVHIEGEGDVGDLDMGVFRERVGNNCVWDPARPDPLTGELGYWAECELGKKDPTKVQPNKPYIDPFSGETSEFLDSDCKSLVGGMSCGGGVNVNYDADGDADERVKWLNPLDGFYYVKVLGYEVYATPGHFDLSIGITLATGKGYQIPEADPTTQLIAGTEAGLSAFQPVTYHLAWDFPADTADGGYGGAILLGTPSTPGVIVIPVNVILARVEVPEPPAPGEPPPDVEGPAVTGTTISVDTGYALDATGTKVNDPTPQFVITAADATRGELDPLAFRLVFDGLDVTSAASISAPYDSSGGSFGRWSSTIVYTPPELEDGVHLLSITVADLAGNTATAPLVLTVDTEAPFLLLDADRAYTTQVSYLLTGQTAPGAWVSAGGDYVASDALGNFRLTVPLVPGSNSLTVQAVDWFGVDASGAPQVANAETARVVVLSDALAPAFDRALSADSGSPTRADSAEVSGEVSDLLAAGQPADPTSLEVVVNGVLVPARGDGSFSLRLALTEGANQFTATVTDPAGSFATATLTVLRDTRPPELDLEAVPERSATGYVDIAGTTADGATVFVNGYALVPDAGGGFARNVTLSPGLNRIEVRVVDDAGNENVQRFSVLYPVHRARGTVVGGATLGLAVAGAAALGFLIGLLFTRFRKPRKEAPEAAPEAPPSGPAGPPAPVGEIPPPPDVAPAAPADPRVERLERAYREGKITKGVYETNLRKLRGG